MRRRELLLLLGGAMTASPVVRAQQKAMPVIGFLGAGSPGPAAPFVAAFRQGLRETGYVEGQNVAIEYRWAEDQYDRLLALAADLVRRRVAVILAAGGNAPALAAKEATSEIPIVFVTGGDPIRAGLVASLNRPGANVTGVTFIASALVPKRLELLHDLIPQATAIGALVNPNYPEAELQRQELQEAAHAIGRSLHILSAGTPSEIDGAFSVFAKYGTETLLVANDPLFIVRRDQIAALAGHHAIPAIYSDRAFVKAGGLISYGASMMDALRRVGIYTGRILNGAKPSDLPVEQPTRFELVVNLKTAKALGITIPYQILGRADEVIE
jgi:putative tryptophan/tyrosine transport system substrate-binding protein